MSDLARCDMAEAVEDAFRYDRLVLATTTYNGGMFPFMQQFIDELTERNFQNRYVGFIENGSWGPAAMRAMKKELEGAKNIKIAENNVTIKSKLNDASRGQIEALAKELTPGHMDLLLSWQNRQKRKRRKARKRDLSAISADMFMRETLFQTTSYVRCANTRLRIFRRCKTLRGRCYAANRLSFIFGQGIRTHGRRSPFHRSKYVSVFHQKSAGRQG